MDKWAITTEKMENACFLAKDSVGYADEYISSILIWKYNG